ncbi:ABC transporter ATP-binding protein [Alphaproteobacteria bacterium]|nr:ABC transporter ATP-binding protein [Alphaproteobacteria bacterium]
MVSAAKRETFPSVGMSVDVRNVSHAFTLKGKRLPVLDAIDFSVAPGEFVALLGPSGCGKSTLLRMAAGLDEPEEGEILADGVRITGPDPSRVVVFQDPTLFPWRTIYDNVALGLEAQGLMKEHKDRIAQTLALVGLQDFGAAYPQHLSGGMQQRAALARALVNEPRLMVLDEPLGKLDSLTRMSMQTEIVELWRRSGFSILLVTHDVEEALFMANRVIVFSARPAAIKADISVERDYPRKRGDPYLVELRHQLLSLLGLDGSW